jgi:hypothetical protein
MTETAEAMPSAVDLTQRLEVETLPAEEWKALRGIGETLVPQLLEIIARQRKDVPLEDAWAPIHAVALLEELNWAGTIQALVALVAEGELELDVQDGVTDALGRMGPTVGLEVLSVLPEVTDEWARQGLLQTLSDCGHKSDQAFAALKEELNRDPESGAALLAAYGDVRALPFLRERLASWKVDEAPGNPFKHHAVIELCGAIETFGEELTEDEALKLRRAKYVGRIAFNRRYQIEAVQPVGQ